MTLPNDVTKPNNQNNKNPAVYIAWALHSTENVVSVPNAMGSNVAKKIMLAIPANINETHAITAIDRHKTLA